MVWMRENDPFIYELRGPGILEYAKKYLEIFLKYVIWLLGFSRVRQGITSPIFGELL